jgi:2-keto-3-deoxy-L-rhamnonate aldolase RhmA
MFTPTIEEAHRWLADGATLFLLGSDQQFVLQGARDLRTAFDRPEKA